MDKSYQYNDKVYRLKPVTLSVMKNVIPLLSRLRLLQHEYTKGIDMTGVNSLRQRINELETAREQLNEKDVSGFTSPQRTELAEKKGELTDKISGLRTGLEQNEDFRKTIKLFNECSALAVLEVLSDKELIEPVINSVLTGANAESVIPVEINFDDPTAVGFLIQVLADFFFAYWKEHEDTGRIKALMPAAFELKFMQPQHLNVPECFQYDYMIYRLAKLFGVTPGEAAKMSEKDFWMFMAFENLDNKRNEYFLENLK